jgi:hypothetical protein
MCKISISINQRVKGSFLFSVLLCRSMVTTVVCFFHHESQPVSHVTMSHNHFPMCHHESQPVSHVTMSHNQFSMCHHESQSVSHVSPWVTTSFSKFYFNIILLSRSWYSYHLLLGCFSTYPSFVPVSDCQLSADVSECYEKYVPPLLQDFSSLQSLHRDIRSFDDSFSIAEAVNGRWSWMISK